jgi:saccharopine dehydrogenase-like NADP-dependent oxidoreductase
MGLISEYSGDVPVISNGNLTFIPALSAICPYENGYECSPTSNNSPATVKYLHSLGVRNYDYMTIRYSGHWDAVCGWRDAGFLQGNSEMDRKLAEALEQNPRLVYDPANNSDKILLSVVGKRGENSLREIKGFDFTVFSDLKTRFSAMELMTSWGITMVAHYIAKSSGKRLVPNEFAVPERFVDANWVLKGLNKRLPS